MKILLSISFFFCFLLTTQSSFAGRKNQNCKGVFNTPDSKIIDPIEQYKLGIKYYKAYGVPQDFAKAAFWFKKSAEGRYVPAQAHFDRNYFYEGSYYAQNYLGLMYEKGLGVPQDYDLARHWYGKALKQGLRRVEDSLESLFEKVLKIAEQGDATAQFVVGKMYRKGQGMAKDRKQAALWYQKSADQGYAPAKLELADFYRFNHGGLGYNYKKALELQIEAAEQGDIKAQKDLHDLYGYSNYGHKYKVYYNPTLALYWFEEAAKQGDLGAQFDLAIRYKEASNPDYNKSLYWLKRLAKKGHTLAQYHLGQMYEKRLGVPYDYKKAISWYRKSAEQDVYSSDSAQLALGKIYYYGIHSAREEISPNPRKALSWYRKSAKWGNYEAKVLIGDMYFKGVGVSQNYSKAAHWYSKVATKRIVYGELGDRLQSHARYRLGIMYRDGKGVPQNTDMALFFLGQAAYTATQDKIYGLFF